MATEVGAPFLVCRLGTELIALPVLEVSETMRPLPIEPLAGAPDFVLGLAMIRGMAIPVVDAGRLAANAKLPSTRFVVVRAGERRVALAVEAVIGVRTIPAGSLEGLPPLLASGNSKVVDAIGTLDSKLFLVLGSARLVPESTWRALEAVVAAS